MTKDDNLIPRSTILKTGRTCRVIVEKIREVQKRRDPSPKAELDETTRMQ